MKCTNLTCDRSEELGYRMVETEVGYLCSMCHHTRTMGVLEGIRLADKTIEAEWKKSKKKIGELNATKQREGKK